MPFNILIADDSRTMRYIVARSLGVARVPLGCLYYAGDGSEALEILNREWIDLVLLDINMPVVDGIALVEAMSADAVLESIPVVVISSDVSPVKVARLKDAGVKAFVKKPFTPETIRDTVMAILGGSGANA